MLFLAFCIFASVVWSMVSNADCVAPTLFTISCTLELKPSTPFESNVTAAFPASALPNISANDKPLLLASSCTICNTSPRLFPLAINSLKLLPVADRSNLSVFEPDLPSSFIILFRYVVVSAAAIPLLVIIA